MKYQAIYKCSLCNGLMAYGDPKEMTKEQCVGVIAKSIKGSTINRKSVL